MDGMSAFTFLKERVDAFLAEGKEFLESVPKDTDDYMLAKGATDAASHQMQLIIDTIQDFFEQNRSKGIRDKNGIKLHAKLLNLDRTAAYELACAEGKVLASKAFLAFSIEFEAMIQSMERRGSPEPTFATDDNGNPIPFVWPKMDEE